MKTYKQFTEAYKHLLSEESQAGHDLAVLQSIVEDLAMGGVKDTVSGLIKQLETIVGEQIKESWFGGQANPQIEVFRKPYNRLAQAMNNGDVASAENAIEELRGLAHFNKGGRAAAGQVDYDSPAPPEASSTPPAENPATAAANRAGYSSRFM